MSLLYIWLRYRLQVEQLMAKMCQRVLQKWKKNHPRLEGLVAPAISFIAQTRKTHLSEKCPDEKNFWQNSVPLCNPNRKVQSAIQHLTSFFPKNFKQGSDSSAFQNSHCEFSLLSLREWAAVQRADLRCGILESKLSMQILLMSLIYSSKFKLRQIYLCLDWSFKNMIIILFITMMTGELFMCRLTHWDFKALQEIHESWCFLLLQEVPKASSTVFVFFFMKLQSLFRQSPHAFF